MKEHKSHMNMVARFAYIFATIVTVFAQMGLAPLITTQARVNPTVTMKTDKSGYSTGDTVVLSLTSSTTDTIDLAFDAKKLQYVGVDMNSNAKARTSNTGISVTPKSTNTPVKIQFKVLSDLGTSGISMAASYTDSGWFSSDVYQLGSIQITGSGSTSESTNNNPDDVKLTLPEGAKINRNASGAVTDASIKLHIAGSSAMSGSVTQKGISMPKVASGTHFTITWTGTGLVPTQTADQFEVKMNAIGFYFTWDVANNKVLVTAGQDIAAGWSMDMPFAMTKDTGDVTFTVIDDDGNPEDTIKTTGPAGPAGVDGTGLRLDPHSVGKDVDGAIYRMSTFPMFYMKETDDSGTQLYSFIYNNNSTGIEGGAATHSLEKLRQAILFGSGYSSLQGGGAGSTTSAEPGYFENFHQIGSDGYAIAGSEKKFDVDKTYTLIPYNPLTTGSDRFKRIDTTYASKDYYMPDGVPTFSVDASGNITLKSQGDGNAVKGQWTATGKTINAALYKVKKLKIVDQNGDPVTDAKLTLKNADGESAFMQASTASDGTGEFLPNDYDDANKGPFYYADGAQAFDKLTLPSGYSQDVAFSKLTLSKTDDTLSLSSDKKNAEITDNGQTLTLTVHKYDSKDTDITINKVAKADPDKNLGGATLHVEEVDGASDAVASKDVKTQDSDGLATLTVDATSATTERIFHVTETQAPDGYLIANKNGYYATWTKGSGFTAVGDTQDATGTASADGLATVKDGKLVIQDPDAYNAGGASTKMEIQYVDSVEFGKFGTGTKIVGSQLPVLNENQVFDGTGLSGFSGLGGVIYNPDTDPSTLIKPDSGIASGTLQNDGTMYKSLEKSGTDGIGIVQGLWSQTGLVYGWEALDHNSNGWILSNAIVSGTIPETPMIGYQLISPEQRQRAVGSAASGYYNLGGTLTITGDGSKIVVKNDPSNKLNKKDRDNSVKSSGWPVQVELYKVKHVRVVDTAGNKVPNAVVKFSNMTATTGSDGSDGELLPNDVNNQPTTKGDNFVFPDGKQSLQSVTDAANKALIGGNGQSLGSPNGYYFVMGTGGSDQLQGYGGSNATVVDSGQTVQITVKAPTTIKIHKQDFVHPDTAVAGATFKVWADGDEANAVTTPSATDDNGDTSVTLANSSDNDTYHIQEVKAPDGYKLDQTDYAFTWTPKTGVSAVKDTTDHVMASDGVLHFADLKTGGGGVGDNGTNGGTLTIKKVDLGDASATVPDGATFELKQTMGGSVSDTQTTKNGQVSFNVGDATTGDKVFKITETAAPKGYTKAKNSYLLRIQPDGTMTLGAENTRASDITADHTDDNVIKFASSTDHTLVFGDTKDTNNNGGLFALKKTDSSNAAVTPPDGARFQLIEKGNTVFAPKGTTANGLISFDLGKTTTTTRTFTLYERQAPLGYVWNTQAYTVSISPTGVVSVGVGDANSNPTLSTTQTSDKVVTVTGKGITFADDPVTTQKNGGDLIVKKVDAKDRTVGLAGAVFAPSEYVNGATELLGSDEMTGVTTDAQGDVTLQLGQPTNTTRKIMLREGQTPTGYAANNDTYWILIDPSGKITFSKTDMTTGNLVTPAAATVDGVLQLDANNQVTFGDSLTPVASSFTIKKTALSDRKTAITKNLNGASFSATEVALSGETSLGNFELQASGSTKIITTSKSDNRLRLVKIQETKAPSGYGVETKPYYVTLSALDGVVGVSQDAKTTTDQKSADGVVQIDDKNTVNFGDDVKKNSFSIKKTDASDPTKGVSGDATFEIQRLDAAAKKATGDVYTVTTKDGAVTSRDLAPTDQSLTDGIFTIRETAAPSGYEREKNSFNFKWTADQGVTYISQNGDEWTNYSATKLNGAAGKQALSVENGVLNFSDVKTAGPVLTIKKVAFGTSTGLAGATFSVTDIGNGSDVVPSGGDTRGSAVTPLSATTGSDGTQQFSITPTPTSSKVFSRVFKVVETTAPAGYVLNSKPYYIGWDDKNGINGVNTDKTRTTGFKASPDQVAKLVEKSGTTLGYATIGDISSIYNIKAVQRTATTGDAGKPVGNVSITLSNPDGTGGTAQTVTTDAASGSVDVSADTVAKALGISSDKMTGNVDVRLDISNSSNLTSPVSRIVRYTFPSSSGAGFAVYGGAAPTDATPLKQNDGMVVDSSSTDKLSVDSGDLDLLLRKDTLNANAIDDTNTVGTGLAGVKFDITFTIGGKKYTKQVITQANGQLTLPDPNTLLGVKNAIAPNDPASVTIKQAGTFAGYAPNEDTANLLYTTGRGYYSLTGVASSDNGTLTMTQSNGGIDSVKSILYFFGDSSINFYLTKELDSLNLDSVPDSMNFGKVEAQIQAHKYPLLRTTDDDQAVFDTSTIGLTDPNVATSETNGVMSAQVTQQGTYADGWRLQLTVGDLTSEDKSEFVKNGTITFDQYPTVTKDNQNANIANAGLTSTPTLNMGTSSSTDMLNTGANAQAGVYKINMNVADVSMKIPMYSGVVNKNYQAPMTWTIDDTPTK